MTCFVPEQNKTCPTSLKCKAPFPSANANMAQMRFVYVLGLGEVGKEAETKPEILSSCVVSGIALMIYVRGRSLMCSSISEERHCHSRSSSSKANEAQKQGCISLWPSTSSIGHVLVRHMRIGYKVGPKHTGSTCHSRSAYGIVNNKSAPGIYNLWIKCCAPATMLMEVLFVCNTKVDMPAPDATH